MNPDGTGVCGGMKLEGTGVCECIGGMNPDGPGVGVGRGGKLDWGTEAFP